MILRLKYIHKVKGRSGGFHYYLRRQGYASIRLPDRSAPDFLAAYQAALKATENVPRAPLPRTFGSMLEAWTLTAHFKGLRASTQATYLRLIIDMQKQDYAPAPVDEFEPVHIKRIMARHSDTPAAANTRLKIMRSAFEYAVNDGWRSDNPATLVKRYKEVAAGATPWSEEQIEQYLTHWPVGTMQRRALMLLLHTGQRRSDVVQLGQDHIDGDLLNLTQRKTGKALSIPIVPELEEELELAPRAGTFLQTSKGNPFTANGFYMRFKKWREEAGLPKGLSPHGLRKAAARRLAESGCSAHQIAAITGHESLKEVERYTRSADQKKLAREAMGKMKNCKTKTKNCKTS